ncbi:MAG: hypothetical protein ACYCXQ_05805 [Candidatus Humimicrobiaceae bacterium]
MHTTEYTDPVALCAIFRAWNILSPPDFWIRKPNPPKKYSITPAMTKIGNDMNKTFK